MGQDQWSGMVDITPEFLAEVYDQVKRIPEGRVSTYGEIAALAGYPKASREVGIAMGRVPDGSGLACHRVVNKNGTLAPAHVFGGQEIQRRLLAQEGITFRTDGTINMQKHMWPEALEGEQMTLF